MTDCCQGSAFANSELKEPETKNTRYIHFSALTPDEQQIYIDFRATQKIEYERAIKNINEDFSIAKERFSITPRLVYMGSQLLWGNKR